MATDYLARIRLSLKARGKRRHNTLYWFFWKHFDEIADDRLAGDRADWVAVADSLNALGLKVKVQAEGGGGMILGPIKPETARRTFARVKADREAQRQKPRDERLAAPNLARVSMVPARPKD